VGDGHGLRRHEADRGADGRRIFTSFLLELVVYPPVYQLWKWNFELKHKLAPAGVAGGAARNDPAAAA